MNGKKEKSAWKMTEIAGLAVSIPFMILAGPFVGYFIGRYLRDKFGMHRYVMYILIVMGFVASFYNTVVIIKMMLKINKEKSRAINAKD